ncbi:MAG: hypothetical protein PUG43_00680 [Clostridiales bacterium]|nr:hypothetical protein [Clostridiales bacterium]MDD7347050.1 hypothetical protein [Clostridiales bacterium]MDY4060276.1 hypothetical protein [Anaerovoracaceae bacterium]
MFKRYIDSVITSNIPNKSALDAAFQFALSKLGDNPNLDECNLAIIKYWILVFIEEYNIPVGIQDVDRYIYEKSNKNIR